VKSRFDIVQLRKPAPEPGGAPGPLNRIKLILGGLLFAAVAIGVLIAALVLGSILVAVLWIGLVVVVAAAIFKAALRCARG
jgi:hypothetical protein